MSEAPPSLDLRPDHWDIVRGILRRHVPGRKVLAFGSRATWTAKEYSDLDLAVLGDKPLPLDVASALAESFVESDLPFKVDVVDWASTSESFRKVIERDYVVLVEKEERDRNDEWIECTLADTCSSIDYGLTASASIKEIGPHFLRITDIVSGHIDWQKVPYVKVDDELVSKYQLYDGDIVIARTGASTGASMYVKNPPLALFASYLVRLQAKPGFDARFLAYFLKSEDFWEFIRGVLGDKSAQPNASASTMTAAPLRVPKNNNEQHVITHILGTLDDKIELNRRMNETMEAMARALFKSWFVDFDPVRAKMEGRDTGLPKHIADLFPDFLVDSELGEIPEGWEVNTIGEIVKRKSVKKKYSQKTALKSGNVPILDQGKSGIIGYHNNAPGVDASPSNPIIVFANHTCYMRLIMHEFSAIQNVLPFEGKNHDIYWLYCATIGKQEFIEYKGHWPDFSIKEIIIPGRILQSEFGKVVAVLFQQIHLNDSQSHILANIRDALLPKLLSGELWVGREKVNSP